MGNRRTEFQEYRAFARGLRILALAAAVSALPGCSPPGEESGGGGGGSDDVSAFCVTLLVTDEDGNPVEGATSAIEPQGGLFRLDGLRGPALLSVEAPGFLPEPVVVGREDAGEELRIRLLKRVSPSGARRLAIHFTGDTMLGRRFLDPNSERTPLIAIGDGGESARGVAAAVAPLFRAADIRSLNLETVLGLLPEERAYPGKRYLLQSPPETLSLLNALGANLVILGNNHARDWLDDGIASTVALLEGAGLPHVGAGATEAAAREPLVLEFDGRRIGCLSYTSVNGDPVNDRLPDDAARAPYPLDPDDAWKYEFRSFGYRSAYVEIPEGERRAGGFWRVFKAVEDGAAPEDEIADLWARAWEVYPELQDWTARRGHGGANPYSRNRVAEDIRALRDSGCELVLVQLHAGYQYADFKSEFVERAARAAIDAGADIVVCHHPHVLQGFEWYREKLIAHSLGNFVFDQDFFATFSTAVLRAVFEESPGGGYALLEARLFPVEIVDYRPVPLAGAAALRVLRTALERSDPKLRSKSVGGVPLAVLGHAGSGVGEPRFRFERHTALIERGPTPTEARAIALQEGEVLDLELGGLTRSRARDGTGFRGLLLGRDLLGWGDFEDYAADGVSAGGAHWDAGKSHKRIEIVSGRPSGFRALRLRRSSANQSRVLASPVARIPIPKHRVYREEASGAVPADGNPRYTVRLHALLEGSGSPFLRFTFYRLDDSDPTEDPTSVAISTREVPLEVPEDSAWHEILFDIPSRYLVSLSGVEANYVFLSVGLAPPPEGTSYLYVDDIQFIEWRRSGDLPDRFYAIDALRAEEGSGPLAVEIEQTMP